MKASVVVIHQHLFQRTPTTFNHAQNGKEPLNFICVEKGCRREDEEAKFITSIKQNNAIAAVLDSKPFSEDFFNSLPNNFLLCRFGVGINNICFPIIKKKNITVVTSKGASATATAEHTFALLLALTRHITSANENLKAGKWIRREGISLKSKKICILGLGDVGRKVARIAIEGFAMRAFALVKPNQLDANNKKISGLVAFTISSLPHYLQQSNFISLHLPLTAETHNILNKEMLKNCMPGALLINTARAALINEETLIEMLKSKRLGGAALDVFNEEPFRLANNPLNNTDITNLILSPHVAGHTTSANIATGESIVKNVRLFIKGERKSMSTVNPSTLHKVGSY